MKKNILICLIVLIIIVILGVTFLLLNVKNELKSQDEKDKIVKDSNLEILLNLENFDTKNYSDEKLLEVSMLFAEKKGYLAESTEDFFIQYINQSELHDIINALTNISVEAPIQIEDFYYIYDSENEYYYIQPVNFPKYEISDINHVYKDDNKYTIECTAIMRLDNEIISKKNFITTLKLVENNSYTNYQIISQQIVQTDIK